MNHKYGWRIWPLLSSYSVNGVAKLHTELLKAGLFNNFYQLSPQKFNNKTNGVTPRRWLMHCNPELAALISEHVGDKWQSDFAHIAELRRCYDNHELQQRWLQVKQNNKQRLAIWCNKSVMLSLMPP